MLKNFNLHIECGNMGLWYITSPEIPGLMIAKSTLHEALADVMNSWAELMSAKRSDARQER